MTDHPLIRKLKDPATQQRMLAAQDSGGGMMSYQRTNDLELLVPELEKEIQRLRAALEAAQRYIKELSVVLYAEVEGCGMDNHDAVTDAYTEWKRRK